MTRWRIDPSRDQRQPPRIQTDLSTRPQIYVHFEFGVSWTPRATPKSHSLTYVSRNLRDRRSPNFPRQLPPPNTNYLQEPLEGWYAPTRPRALTHRSHEYYPTSASPARQQPRVVTQPAPQLPYLVPQEVIDDGFLRQSRSASRGSRDRGRSAPPPLNDSPWDAEPEPFGHSALPRRDPPEVWKDLPSSPSQFRLGEDGMPWSAWSWPGPDSERQPPQEAGKEVEAAVPRPRRMSRKDMADYGQVRDLAALSSAMMTVDNGFENQWWYQGQRERTVDGDLQEVNKVSVQPRNDQLTVGTGSLPWAVGSNPLADPMTQVLTHHSTMLETPSTANATIGRSNSVVSPVTDFGSPPTTYLPAHRRGTSRSSELFYYK